MGVVFTLGMLLSMLSAFAGAVPAAAATLAFSGDPSGPASKAVTASFTNIAVSSDGKTIYGAAIAPPAPLPTLYKSTNGGTSFVPISLNNASYTSPVPDFLPSISLLAVAPDDPTIVAFASNSDYAGNATPTVYLSTNGGTTWSSITNTATTPAAPLGFAGAGASISDIQISQSAGGVHYIGIVGKSGTGANKVAVSYYAFGATVPGWTDATGLTGGVWAGSGMVPNLWAARAIKFSPQFASDRTFVIVTEIGSATTSTNPANQPFQSYTTNQATSAYLEIANISTARWDSAAGFSQYTGALGQNGIALTPAGTVVYAPGGSSITATPNVTLQMASLDLAPNYLGADSTTRIAFVGLATDSTMASAETPLNIGAAGTVATAGSGVYRFNDATEKLISNTIRINTVAFNGTTLLAGDYDDNAVWSDSVDPLSSSPTLTQTSQFLSPSGTAPSYNTYTLAGSGSPYDTRPFETNSPYKTFVRWAGKNAVATNTGIEGAFAISVDNGVTFKDTSMIRTNVYDVDSFQATADGTTAYMITDNSTYPFGGGGPSTGQTQGVAGGGAPYSNGVADSVVVGGVNNNFGGVATGGVTAITLTNGGTGYTPNSVGNQGQLVYNVAVKIAAASGRGQGAAGVAEVTGGVITRVILTAPGAGYDNTVPPTITFVDNVNLGHVGQTAATATLAVTTGAPGTVLGMVVTNQGAGYTAVPTVNVTGAGGSGASIIVPMTGAGAPVPAGTGSVYPNGNSILIGGILGVPTNQFVPATAGGNSYSTAPSALVTGPGPSGNAGTIALGTTPPATSTPTYAAISVWQWTTAGWTRVLALNAYNTAIPTSPLATGAVVDIAPDNAKTVYVGMVGTNNLYYSADAGNTWNQRYTGGFTTGSGVIQDIAVESASTLYYLTSGARVAQSTNNGFIWTNEIAAGGLSGANRITSLGAKTLLVSGLSGSVAYSADSGNTWGTTSGTPTPAGSVPLLATATGVTSGKYIFAVAPTMQGDYVYRYTIGGTAGWEQITPALNTIAIPNGPNGTLLPSLHPVDVVLDKSGILYAVASETYSNTPVAPVVNVTPGSGFDSFLMKTQDPTLAASTLTAASLTGVPTNWGVISMGGTNTVPVIAGMGIATATSPSHGFQAVTVSGSTKIFANAFAVGPSGQIVNSPPFPKALLLGFTDSIGAGGALTSPADKSTITVNPVTGLAYDVVYSWKRSATATSYQLQIAQDSAFSTLLYNQVVSPSNPAADPVSVVVGPSTDSNPNDVNGRVTVSYNPLVTYYARVRVNGIVLNSLSYNWFSLYGASNGFSIASAVATIPPNVAVTLNYPAAGQTGVPLTPTFSWSAVPGANSYSIQVDTDPSFPAPVVKNNSVFTNVYVPTSALKNSTVYYWRVQATAGTVTGAWTAGVFTTAAPPTSVAPTQAAITPTYTVSIPAQTTPGYIWAVIAIGAILVIAVVILIMRTGRKS